MIKLKEIVNEYYLYLFFLLAFSIPLGQKLSTIILLLLVGVSIVHFKKMNINRRYIPLIALYFTYLFFEIIHVPFDASVTEKKASLLAIPIVFTLNEFNKEGYKQIFAFFVYGTVFACLICYINAVVASITFVNGFHFNFQLTNKISNGFLESSMYGRNHFFGDNFSIFHQSVYFALFLNISAVILLFTDIIKVKFKYFILVLIGLVIFQISNRVNIFVFFILVISSLFVVKNVKIKFSLFTFGLVLGAVIMFNNPRTKELIDKVLNFELVLDREADNSFETRLLVWDASVEVAKNNLYFGVGFSNVYDELKKVYKEKRYVVPYRNRLNSHNQYLQILIECGILGLIVLFIIQGILLFKSNTDNKVLIIYFLIVININFMFETVLNRYSGLVCFAFFYCLIVGLKKEIKE